MKKSETTFKATSPELEWHHNIVTLFSAADSEKTLNAALAKTVEQIIDLTACNGAVIRIDPADGNHAGYLEESKGSVNLCFPGLDAPGCVCEEAMVSGEIKVSTRFSEPGCQDAGFKSVMCAPVFANDENIGILMAASYDDIALSADKLNLVTLAMNLAGKAVARVRKYKIALTRASDLKTVNTVGGLITSKLTLKDMTREIVTQLGDVLETDEVNVVLYNGVRKELSFLARYFADESELTEPETYPLSDGINSWIIRNRRPLLMKYDTLAECKQFGIRHGGRPAKSWLGAPMIYQDQVIGVLSVQSYSKTGLYDERSAYLLEIVAGQCAVAVENARLFEEVVSREAEKERLYFSLTHDLLSLVSPVAGFVKLIKSLPENSPIESFSGMLENLTASSEKITRFVEDILVYSKIKSGKLTLNIERADVLNCLESALMLNMPEMTMRRLNVSLNGTSVKPGGTRLQENLMADFDVAQIERVFLNLISNAVKYTNSRIDLEAVSDNEKIVCRIIDDGPGVKENHLEALFNEYYQADEKMKGVGLGLPTVKKIVELHHGKIYATATPGKGFMIEFSWPRTLADRQEKERVEQKAL